MTTTAQRIHFQHLDVLRFVAAYAIVVFHMYYGWQANWGHPAIMEDPPGQLGGPGRYVESIIHDLMIGVDLFFLISGFLITYLLLEERRLHGRIAIGRFYGRRALRIWPLYFLVVATGPLLTALFNEPGPATYLPHLVFLGNFELIANGFSSASLNHLWSICIEEHFYLICPLIVATVPRRHLVAVFLGIMALSILYRWHAFGGEGYWMRLYLHTFSRMDVLALGCIGGVLHHQGRLRFRGHWSLRWAAAMAFVGLLASGVYVAWDSPLEAMLKKYLYILPLAYLIGDLMFNANLRWRPPSRGPLPYLGRASYGIYMYNPLVIAVFVKLFLAHGITSGWLFIAGVHLALLAVVVISFEALEKPVLRFKERFSPVATRRY
jgi:peptidoglycan/LPS O-acetylase OafA/YrhL